MAENFRHDDSAERDVSAARAALIRECAQEEESCLYTSTSFFIWLRILKTIRAALWIGGVVGSFVSASHILRGDADYRILMAWLALAGVLLPGIVRAVKLDAAIGEYADAAGRFKNLQGEFRRAAKVWSHKPFPEFEAEARKIFKAMNEARKPSLTPPEFCFRLAQRKVKRGDYDSDDDGQGQSLPHAPVDLKRIPERAP